MKNRISPKLWLRRPGPQDKTAELTISGAWVARWLEPGYTEFAYVIGLANTKDEAVTKVTPWIQDMANRSVMARESLLGYPLVYPNQEAVIADFSQVFPLEDSLKWAEEYRWSCEKGPSKSPTERRALAYFKDHHPAFDLGTGIKAWEAWCKGQTTGG